MNKFALKKNIFASVSQQIVSVVCGLITPRLLLNTFGSEVNGLVSSITHLMNIIVLIEGGVTGVIMANLYNPLNNNDIDTISAIVNTSKKFFRKLSLLFAIYTIVFGFVYASQITTSFSHTYVYILILVLSINMFVQYCFSIPYQLLLRAAQKLFIVSITSSILTIANTVLIAILINVAGDIIIVKLGSAVVFGIQPFVYYYYVNKYYKLDQNAKPNNKLLSQRWSSFGQNLAYYIHSNTDVVLLTVLSTFQTISVYSIYTLIINAITGLISSVTKAIQPAIGSILHRDNSSDSKHAMELFITSVCFMVSFAFGVCNVMIVPFIRIYTSNVTDFNYIVPEFATIIVFAEAIYCFRDPYVSAIYAIGHFKQTKVISYLEAIINIVVSIPCLYLFGLSGVAFGTACGMIFRLIASAYYVNKHIINGINNLFIKTLISFIIIYCCSTFIGVAIQHICIINYAKWIFMSISMSIVVIILDIICGLLFYRKYFCEMLKDIINII